MTRKRRRLLVGLGVGMLAVALAGVAVLRRRPDPFRERCDRIREGMTFEEVEATMMPYEFRPTRLDARGLLAYPTIGLTSEIPWTGQPLHRPPGNPRDPKRLHTAGVRAATGSA